MKLLHQITVVLVWIGGLNWGLVGLFDYNLVESLFGAGLAQFIYVLVGASTVYIVLTHKSFCEYCGGKKK
jgi:uncharacterized membrane protein YuzA (DUF378 family)